MSDSKQVRYSVQSVGQSLSSDVKILTQSIPNLSYLSLFRQDRADRDTSVSPVQLSRPPAPWTQTTPALEGPSWTYSEQISSGKNTIIQSQNNHFHSQSNQVILLYNVNTSNIVNGYVIAIIYKLFNEITYRLILTFICKLCDILACFLYFIVMLSSKI